MHQICSADSIGFLEGIFIAPDAETTSEKGSELHLSQRVCVAGSSPKWPFVFSSSSPNWKQINHFRKNHEKPFQLVVCIKKFGPWGEGGNFAETVWPWMRLALGVSFKSRPRNHANRLTKVTSLDTMRKVRGCWMLPSFRNQPQIRTRLLKWWKKHAGISKPPFFRKLLEIAVIFGSCTNLLTVTDRIMDASSPESQIWDSIKRHVQVLQCCASWNTEIRFFVEIAEDRTSPRLKLKNYLKLCFEAFEL